MSDSIYGQQPFFDITSKDLVGQKSVSKLVAKDVILFSIQEEIGKITTGTLNLYDPGWNYSRIFRNGISFEIGWGYRSIPGLGIFKAAAPQRTGLRCVCQTPSGAGSENGDNTFSATFYATEFLSGRKHKVFQSGNRYSVITELLNDLGVDQDKQYIDFDSQNDVLTTEKSVRQMASSFAFLYELSREWKTTFHIGYQPNGKKVGLFINTSKIGQGNYEKYLKVLRGIDQRDKEFYYNVPTKGIISLPSDMNKSNVMSYTWQQHVGDSGQGSNVEVRYDPNSGQVLFIRRIAETKKVITYRINPLKIKQEFKGKDITETTSLLQNMLSKTSFDEVKWAFDAIEETTAPEGLGFSVNLKMPGDPFLTVPLIIKFRDGFPSFLQEGENPFDPNKVNEFFVRKTSHEFSKTGYFTTVEVVDSFAQNGSAIAQTDNIS